MGRTFKLLETACAHEIVNELQSWIVNQPDLGSLLDVAKNLAQCVIDPLCSAAELLQQYLGALTPVPDSSGISASVNLSDPYNVFLMNLHNGSTLLGLILSWSVGGDCNLTIYFMVECVISRNSIPLVRNEGTTYGNVFLNNTGGSGGAYYGPDTSRERELHHEQVHAQQWANDGLSFASKYIAESISAEAKARLHQTAGSDGAAGWLGGQFISHSDNGSACYNAYELQANAADGGYQCD